MDTLRRRFILGRFSKQPDGLLPPWARRDIDFYGQCSKCRACIAACPVGLLREDTLGFPQPDFDVGGCDFCGDCARACNLPIFTSDLNSPAWQQTAHIESTCLAYASVTCQSCQDSCDVGAIRFKYWLGNIPFPRVDAESCTGCGMCVQVCPSKAITVIPV